MKNLSRLLRPGASAKSKAAGKSVAGPVSRRCSLRQSRKPIRYFDLDRFVESAGVTGKLTHDIEKKGPLYEAVVAGRYRRLQFSESSDYLPPPPGVVFATVCTDGYMPGLEALVLSLLDVYPDLTNRFVVYHAGNLSPFFQRRLLDTYPHFEFAERSLDKYSVRFGDHANHQRIGALGYLTLEAFELDADRVVIMDSDLLVLDDISPLWTGDGIKAVPDAGSFPVAVIPESTGRPVINSGVISLPRNELGPAVRDAVAQALRASDELECPILERYADQKFWNVYLAGRPVEYLPQNYNVNRALVDRFFPTELSKVAVLHLTSVKPWSLFLPRPLIDISDRRAAERGVAEYPVSFALWQQKYERTLLRHRLGAFRREMAPVVAGLRDDSPDGDDTVVLVGNGPSLARTDLAALEGRRCVAFNWFVHHPEFDRIAPEHLVIPSHMFFGGWHVPDPTIPAEYVDALRSHRHRPRLWVPWFFRDLIERTGDLEGYDVSYIFLEKPFKREISVTGRLELSLLSPLTDANTGVLTVGVPLALAMGARRVALIGCDSNYGQQSQDYFYTSELHASQSTSQQSLHRTWIPDGAGQYGYRVTREQLAQLGVEFVDATVDGALTALPKADLRAWLGRAAGRSVPVGSPAVTGGAVGVGSSVDAGVGAVVGG